MLEDNQIQFLKDQTQTPEGQKWFGILKSIIDSLYYSKGIAPEDVVIRQKAAEALEKILFKAALIENKPKKINEYI